MDGYLDLFFHTGSPVFYTAAKRRKEEPARKSAEPTPICRKES